MPKRTCTDINGKKAEWVNVIISRSQMAQSASARARSAHGHLEEVLVRHDAGEGRATASEGRGGERSEAQTETRGRKGVVGRG